MRAIRIATAVAILAAVFTPLHAAEQTGNRANGKDYQPTPRAVVPAEKQAGVAPSPAQEKTGSHAIELIDRNQWDGAR